MAMKPKASETRSEAEQARQGSDQAISELIAAFREVRAEIAALVQRGLSTASRRSLRPVTSSLNSRRTSHGLLEPAQYLSEQGDRFVRHLSHEPGTPCRFRTRAPHRYLIPSTLVAASAGPLRLIF